MLRPCREDGRDFEQRGLGEGPAEEVHADRESGLDRAGHNHGSVAAIVLGIRATTTPRRRRWRLRVRNSIPHLRSEPGGHRDGRKPLDSQKRPHAVVADAVEIRIPGRVDLPRRQQARWIDHGIQLLIRHCLQDDLLNRETPL